MANEIKIHCRYDELVDPKTLKDYPKNPNQHGSDQIERLANMYDYHGVRHPIIVDPKRGWIAAGHGRKLAAIRKGIKKFPVVYQEFESDDAFYAFVTSDNAIAEWSELDLSGINAHLPELGPDFNIDMLGIKDFKLDLNDDENADENPYTRKVESPIYQPTGEKPKISDLFDTTVSDKLIKEIEASDLPRETKEFLRYASYRHVKFNYKNIAEYYAHAEQSEQNLIENSALVIIDFDKAIELGFVRMTKAMEEAYKNEL